MRRRWVDVLCSLALFASVGGSAFFAKESGDVQLLYDLTLTLMGHEIDRIAAWHNPNGVASKVLLHQSECSFDLTIAPRMDDTAWVRLVDVAWRVSPKLAVKMVRGAVWVGSSVVPPMLHRSHRGCVCCCGRGPCRLAPIPSRPLWHMWERVGVCVLACLCVHDRVSVAVV